MTIRVGYICDQPNFSVEKQRNILTKAGVTKIYVEGDAGETLATALRALRGDAALECAGGIRVLGNSRHAIMEKLGSLDAKDKAIADAENPSMRSDRRGAQMLDSALKMIHREKTMPTEDHAKIIGKIGAQNKWAKLWDRRKSVDEARKVWQDKRLASDQDAADILGDGWSKGTLFRTFGRSGRPPGRRRTTSAYIAPAIALEQAKIGKIYFLRSGNGPVKIGFSRDPKKRISSIKTSHHAKLKLVGLIDGTRDDEQALHEKFREYRGRGEWFKVAGKFESYLAKLPVPEL